MFISITFTETSIDETNKTQQKVRGSKFISKCPPFTRTHAYKHVQSANIGVKCVTFVSEIFTRYGSNITNVWQEIFTPMTLAFSCEVAHEKLWKSINISKSYSKKSVAPFFLDTVFIHTVLACMVSVDTRCILHTLVPLDWLVLTSNGFKWTVSALQATYTTVVLIAAWCSGPMTNTTRYPSGGYRGGGGGGGRGHAPP